MLRKNQEKFNCFHFRVLGGKLTIMIFIIVVMVFLESFVNPVSKSLHTVVSCVLGYIQVSNYNMFLRAMVRLLLPQIALIIVWGNYFDEVLLGNANIIFTRTRRSKKVLFQYTKDLILGVSAMLIIFILMLLLVYKLKGFYTVDVLKLISDLVLYLLYMNMLLLAINMISLVIDVMYSILFVFAFQMVCLQGIYMVKNGLCTEQLYYVIPTSSIMMMLNEKVGLMVRTGWVLYMIVILILFYVVGCLILKRKEFLS